MFPNDSSTREALHQETGRCEDCKWWEFSPVMGIGWHCVREGRPICINRNQYARKANDN